MSYSAIIAPIRIRPHPNADRLQIGLVKGYQVVVGKDLKDGELVVFFPCDGQVSDEFCVANDLYPRLDENGKRVGGGFFDPKNRRVRSQRFRGEKSEGFAAPLSYLAYAESNAGIFKEGVEFTELSGHAICNKYMTKATIEAAARSKKRGARRETTMFKAHLETEQWKQSSQKIKAGAVVYISEKLHGTSQRYGHVLHPVVLPWWKRTINRLWVNQTSSAELFSTEDWKHVIGTRNVILESTDHEPWRGEVIQPIAGQLRKGETIYFEIVGWIDEQTPIMPPGDAGKLQDKEIEKRYGKTIHYTYGCAPGTRKVFVYRITQTNEDGVVTELPWVALKDRCKELGLAAVPTLVDGYISGLDDEVISEIVAEESEGASTLDPKHPREGVCVRVEQGQELLVLKEKGFTFKLLEGLAKEAETYVDVEEAA